MCQVIPKHEFKALPIDEKVEALYDQTHDMVQAIRRPRPTNWKLVVPALALFVSAVGLIVGSVSSATSRLDTTSAKLTATHDQDVRRLETSIQKQELVDAGAVVWRTGAEARFDRLEGIETDVKDILKILSEMKK